MATKMYLLDVAGAKSPRGRNGIKGMVVVAQSSAEAKALAASLFSADADWGTATATEITTPPAAADLAGWRFRVRVYSKVGADRGLPPAIADVSFTAGAGHVIDDVGTALATALALNAKTAHAAYNTGTNLLTIAVGASDALGDHKCLVESFAPGGGEEAMASSPHLGTLTHGGLSSADLTITLVAANPIPTVAYKIGEFGIE